MNTKKAVRLATVVTMAFAGATILCASMERTAKADGEYCDPAVAYYTSPLNAPPSSGAGVYLVGYVQAAKNCYNVPGCSGIVTYLWTEYYYHDYSSGVDTGFAGQVNGTVSVNASPPGCAGQ